MGRVSNLRRWSISRESSRWLVLYPAGRLDCFSCIQLSGCALVAGALGRYLWGAVHSLVGDIVRDHRRFTRPVNIMGLVSDHAPFPACFPLIDGGAGSR